MWKQGIQYIISTIIFFPIIVFLISFWVGHKRRISNTKAFGIAADITTGILFFSVPILMSSLWGTNYSLLVFFILLMIGIILTYIDWRRKKEIEVFPLLKKIWRVYFLILAFFYLIVWVLGLLFSIIEYL